MEISASVHDSTNDGMMQLVLILLAFLTTDLLGAEVVLPARDPPTNEIRFASIHQFLGEATNLTSRQPIRLSGVVTYARQGKYFFIQDEDAGVLIECAEAQTVSMDDYVDAFGYLVRKRGYSPYLTNGMVTPIGTVPPPSPAPISVEQLFSGKYDMLLVQTEGHLLTGPTLRGDFVELQLKKKDFIFPVDLPRTAANFRRGDLPSNSVVRITGICTITAGPRGRSEMARIQMRSPSDIVVVKWPPHWTLDKTLQLLAITTSLFFVAFGWVVSLRYQVRKKTEVIQYLNQGLETRIRQRTADLERINRELEAFSYTVSHDLKAPVRAIKGFAKILEEDHSTQLDGDGQRYLKVIEESAYKMDRLIEDLLAFSRLNQASVTYININMTQLAQESFEELKAQETGRKIEFTLDPLPSACGDIAMIRQIFLNLFSNALKYTRPRSVARIEAGSESKDDQVIYYVKDNGVGFDSANSGKLFGVFQRLHSSKEFEGSGAGLAIVHRIITRHHGRIWAESQVDNGATFYFTLGSQKIVPPSEHAS